MTLLNAWIVRPKPNSKAALRLFCFPHAGVGTSAFRGWAEDLNCDAELCLVNPPGRESRLREGLFSSVTTLVPPLVENIAGYLDRPFAFYGHSLGATVAFETALELRQMGHPQPIHLFVGASKAPQLPWPHPPLRSLPDDDFLSEIQRRYGPIPPEVISDADMRALILRVLRADITAVESYTFSKRAPLDCGIMAFGGLDDEMVARSALEAWRQQTSSDFRLHMLRGKHFFLQSARARLLELISDRLRMVYKQQPDSLSIPTTVVSDAV
jgi:medium-chain acyl-[acyl-carrier-protein] hydrolase